MKAAQKRKLLSKNKDGFFVLNDNYEVKRNCSIIQESVIEESQISYPETGIIWVVDNEKTLEWLEAKENKRKGVKEVKPLVYDGVTITEENLDEFIEDNEISLGRAKSVEAKLKKVKEFINNQ
jgi:hypothetical protein